VVGGLRRVCDVLQCFAFLNMFAMFCVGFYDVCDVLRCFAIFASGFATFAMFCDVLRCFASGFAMFASGFAMVCDDLRRCLQFRNVKHFVSVVVSLVCGWGFASGFAVV